MKAVVLAGGKGARLAPYTKILPKPLMPIDDLSHNAAAASVRADAVVGSRFLGFFRLCRSLCLRATALPHASQWVNRCSRRPDRGR